MWELSVVDASSPTLNEKVMKATIIMSDNDYQRLMAADGKRIRGSLGVINPTTFDFHAFAKVPIDTDNTPRQELRTKHARTTIRPDKVRLAIIVKRGLDVLETSDIIYDEADKSAEFLRQNL